MEDVGDIEKSISDHEQSQEACPRRKTLPVCEHCFSHIIHASWLL